VDCDGQASFGDIIPFVEVVSAGSTGVTQTYVWDGDIEVRPTPRVAWASRPPGRRSIR
jgi:hypothetical protein